MISSYVRIFVRTQGPGSVGLRREKKSQRLHKLSPGVSLGQSEASVKSRWPMRGWGWSVPPVTGRHIVPGSSWADNGPGRGQACHNSSFISTSVQFVTFVTLINTIVSGKAFKEYLRPLSSHSWSLSYEWGKHSSFVTSFDRLWWPITRPISPNQANQANQWARHPGHERYDQSEARTAGCWPMRGEERVRPRQGMWQLLCSVLFPWHWVMSRGDGNKRNKLVTLRHKWSSALYKHKSRNHQL